MVQTYQSPVRIYKYPFEIVMAAYEKRFPTCPQIPIFVGSEIMHEYRSEDGAEWVVERKCQLNVEAPYLVKKIAGVDYIYFTQKNSLDRRQRTLLIEATNISFANRVIINESCQYYVHAENPEWTCFEQNASLDVKSFFGLESAVEKLAVKQYASNLAKGKEILEFFIDELLKSGVTHIPPFAGADFSMKQTKQELEGRSATAHGDGDGSATDATKSPSDSAIDVSNRGDDDLTPTVVSGSEVVGGRRLSAKFTASERKMSAKQTPKRSVGSEELGRRKSSNLQRKGAGPNGEAIRASSFDDGEPKLEEDYIQRFLGQLTMNEESRLCEMTYGLQAEHKGKLPNDAHMLRFLRARDFDVKKASRMLLTSLLWRKQHGVDKILNEFTPPPLLLRYFPGGWHHGDLEGRPLFVLRLGAMDVKGILRAVGVETLLKYTISICEYGIIKAAKATQRLGRPISSISLLVDLEGLSMRHLWRPGIQALLNIIEVMEANYPETLGLVLVTRAPRVFPLVWTLISPFIVENTRRKFMINSDTNSQLRSELEKFIAPEHIPDFLGGPSPFVCECSEVGIHVPKNEYLGDAVVTKDDSDILTSTYTTAVVHKGAPYEIYVEVKTDGSVLTWDFDILRGVCEFLLYYSSRMMKIPANPLSPSTSTALNPVEMVIEGASSLFSSSQQPPFVIAAEPELTIGDELSIREQRGLFFEGDSMQGSHYCKRPGTYILQWRYADAPHSSAASSQHHQSSALFGESYKCKLMVHHQLLDSVDFRGSVASLESCRSSFSSLAAAAIASESSNLPSNAKKQPFGRAIFGRANCDSSAEEQKLKPSSSNRPNE